MNRTFIYGSCVSRDTFDFLADSQFELVTYVARQSLWSATSGPNTDAPPEFQSTSPFQRRMLMGDWEGSLLGLLRQHSEGIDLLLWDLFDERLGANRLANGKVVTRSVDTLSTGLEAALPPTSSRITFGLDQHLRGFTDAVTRFGTELDSLDLLKRTLVVAPPWATTTAKGTPAPPSYSLMPDRANEIMQAYYEVVHTTLGLPLVTVSPTEAVADPEHKWGLAPFHYSRAVYESLASQIASFAADSDLRHESRLQDEQGPT
ncbi:DUF6270 domain-containing protein [Serinicoccus chungangensis]|uniref:DUF6270 domain-containing protein n=1 Tax=Serinicoccus chungangensis TaxID=767452 RepID=UPI0026C8648D